MIFVRHPLVIRLCLALFIGFGLIGDLEAKKKARSSAARVKDANDVSLGRVIAATTDAVVVLTSLGYMVSLNYQGTLIYYRHGTEIQFLKSDCMGAPYFPLYNQAIPYHKILILSFRAGEIFEPRLSDGAIEVEKVTYASYMHEGKCVNYFVDDKDGKHAESTSKEGFRLRRSSHEKAGLPEEIRGPLRLD